MNNSRCRGCDEYLSLSRRNFLYTVGGAAAITAAPKWLPRVAMARDFRGTQRDVIVSIYLRGAADGLSICVPWGENAYYTNRPTIAIPRPDSGLPNAATDLDGFFGFPVAMTPLLPAFNNGHLLVVQATGSTDPTRSHFDAQRFMENGVPNNNTYSGWLGRHLYSVSPTDPNAILRAIGISTGLQRTLEGGPFTLPIPNLDNFGLAGTGSSTTARRAALTDMYAGATDAKQAAAVTTMATIDLLNTINFAGYVPGGGAVYPTGSFGTALKSTAALIRAEVGVEAIAIDLDGWDTHDDQNPLTGQMSTLMNLLARGLAAFYADLWSRPTPGVTVVTMSEFGRELFENGSFGTDHGHGNCMLVMGGCVDGGRVLTNWPGLDPEDLFEDRDLKVTIDYRDILAEIVQNRLGNPDLGYVFPGFVPTPRGVLTPGC